MIFHSGYFNTEWKNMGQSTPKFNFTIHIAVRVKQNVSIGTVIYELLQERSTNVALSSSTDGFK